MESNSSGIRLKKLKSPGLDTENMRNAITCSNMPEALFDVTTTKKHFSKFGKVLRIRLLPKRQMCVIEYDSPFSAEKAVLNAGAYDGFMFDVTRNKPKVRKRSKKEEDPDWVPDSDVEEELNAMGTTPVYRTSRQKPMDLDAPKPSVPVIKVRGLPIKSSTLKKPDINQNDRKYNSSQNMSGTSSPVSVTGSQTSMNSSDAVVELLQLRTRLSNTPDEQWRTLDARDKILRNWGGTGSRVKLGGATIGTCQDMCPEKERLHRQAEHQVMTLETVVGSDGQLELWRAVKQYSRSSADQEMPMCYELRPAHVLMRTCSYLLHEIADTDRQVSLADWFHFMWDRFRGIRKDITQQALCCAESISLVEICARFHAHCAARLADLEHTQFDQKLNTDNLTKCLQTLKHMYADAKPEQKPREAEFRGYIALLNLGDSNFWWEVKQLHQDIQKSLDISFAIKVFNALDNNNYVRFFRLVRDEATYLQACILLRYFNDVRARALARIVKAFAPRGGSRYPAFELMDILAFESIDCMKSYINHYGLRFSRATDEELSIILDRNQFIEDSDPYPIARSIQLIESKRHQSIGEVIAGGLLPDSNYRSYELYTSFTREGYLKDEALLAEGQLYNTLNDTNKDIQTLKADIMKQIQGSKKLGTSKPAVSKDSFLKPQTTQFMPKSPPKPKANNRKEDYVSDFSFKRAIPLFPNEVTNTTPEKVLQIDPNSTFSFSKPQASHTSLFSAASKDTLNAFKKQDANKEPVFKNSQSLFAAATKDLKGESSNSLFSQSSSDKENRTTFAGTSANLFSSKTLFSQKDNTDNGTNIFGRKDTESIFKTPNQGFKTNSNADPKSIFGSMSTVPNGDAQPSVVSPGSLFKSVNQNYTSKPEASTLFQRKTKPFGSVAAQIFESANNVKYDDYLETQIELDRPKAEQLKIELQQQAEMKSKEQQKREEIRRQQEEAKILQEENRIKEENRIQEEKRIKEEKRLQEELIRKEEAKRLAAQKAEEDRQFKEKIEKESSELIESLLNELSRELVYQQLKEATEQYIELMQYANIVSDEVALEMCNEVCMAEITAVKYRRGKVMKKWFYVWYRHYVRNIKRRNLLDDTPVWLSDQSPDSKGKELRKSDESSVLSFMNKIHRGYTFSGEPKLKIGAKPIRILDTIRSPLLKRMKQIKYPYDKCFFWKTTILSPGDMKWMYKKLEIENWLLKAFKDNKKHLESDSLIQVGKESWNNLMNFAISISLVDHNKRHLINEAIAGTNGLIVYASENDAENVLNILNEIIAQKYKYHTFPVAVVIPRIISLENKLGPFLEKFVTNMEISCYKFFIVELDTIGESMNRATKTALRWLAKKYPPIPNLEIDNLKSFCQKYLGCELWYKLKVETSRLQDLYKNIHKLVQFYNTAVDKLSEIISDEDLCNYPSFPLELQKYLNKESPCPKPYEFITSSVKTIDNMQIVKRMIQGLKLAVPQIEYSNSEISMQEYVKEYCNQIGWFRNPDEVVCKVVSLLPDEFKDQNSSCEQLAKSYENYDIGVFLNVVVYEKINSLVMLGNYFIMYDKSKLKEYCNYLWWYEIDVVINLKHKVSDSHDIDDLDYIIESKRIKLALKNEGCMLEERDQTMIEESLVGKDKELSQYVDCEQTVKYLEQKLESESQKSLALEKLLQKALSEN